MSPGPSESVTVTGRGEVEVRPDQAILDLGAEARDSAFDDALAAAGRAVFAMTEVLRAHGVGDTDLRTQGPHTWTVTDEHGRVDAYVCSLQLTARVADPAMAGSWLAECASAAGNAGRANGVRFAVRDRSAPLRQARERAVTDARERAEHLAGLLGRRLGRATSVVETPHAEGPVRPMAARMSMSESAQTEAGVEQVAVVVQVTWAFAD